VAFPKAKEAAQKALEIEPGLAEAHSVLGYVLAHYDRAYEAAEREFQTALRLRPDLPGGHHWHSHLLIALGKRDESLRESLRTKELDPLDAVHNVHLAWHYFFAHEPQQALRFSSELAQQDPRQFWFPWFVALSQFQLGHAAEAVRALQSPAVAGQPFSFLDSQMAISRAALGQLDDVRAIEAKLLAARKQRYVPAYDLALIRLALGDRAGALQRLRETIDEHSAWAIYMAVDPRLQPLIREPAFRESLNLAGLGQVAVSTDESRPE
jgi:tetratricopeptide (TPR) repeat protein